MGPKQNKSTRHNITAEKLIFLTDTTVGRDLVIRTGTTKKERALPSAQEILHSSRDQCAATLRKVGARYRPELYVERSQDTQMLAWLTSESHKRATAKVLCERAGSGKTNLICRMSELLVKRNVPCVFLLGSDPISDRFGLLREALSGFSIICELRSSCRCIKHISRQFPRHSMSVLIDAINEARDVDLFKDALRELLAAFAQIDVRFLITCRDIYWSFLEGEWVDVIKTEIGGLDMYHYDAQAWPVVRERYLRAYNIKGTLVGSAEEKCRHPLLLRFFCEAYEEEEVHEVHEIKLEPLFRRYLQKKVQRITREMPKQLRAKERVISILQNIAAEILDTKQVSVPETRIPALTREADYLNSKSLYVRLLDEDIMIEEVPDENRSHLVRRVRFVYEAFLEFMIAQELQVRWSGLSNEQLISELAEMLEASACIRNMLGALSFLNNFFRERAFDFWSPFIERGPTWQKFVIQTIGEKEESDLDDFDVRAFRSLITASSPETRADATRLLEDPRRSRILDPEQSLLFDRLRNDPRREVRSLAARILKRSWHDLSVKRRHLLLKGMFDLSREVRLIAYDLKKEIWSELKARDRHRFLAHIEEALRSKDGRTRSYAAIALDLDDWPQGRRALLAGLRDDNSWVRSACLIKIRDHPDSRESEIISSLLQDPEARVRSQAATVCRNWRLPQLFKPLIEQARREPDPKTLSFIVSAIAAYESPDTVPQLRELISHPYYLVFYHAGCGLWTILEKRSLDDLVQAYRNRTYKRPWPKKWPTAKAFGGTSGLRELCRSGFSSSDFSAEAGAFFAGLNMPVCACKKRGSDLGQEVYLDYIDWLADFLHSGDEQLVGFLLEGFCHSFHKRARTLIAIPKLRDTLSELVLVGSAKVAGSASQLLAMYSDQMRAEDIDHILYHSSPAVRVQFALGLLQYASAGWLRSVEALEETPPF